MNRIITINAAEKIRKELRQEGKILVLVGGCFDILHIGHVKFLEKAKAAGDILIVLLESDKSIRKLKGENRPINNHQDRASLLSALRAVDYVVLLPLLKTNLDYEKVLFRIKPDIIACTKDDPNKHHKERIGKLLGVQVVDVIGTVANRSTTRVAHLLEQDL